MNISNIEDEVDSAFPFVEMPAGDELSFHKNGCRECDEVREELESYREKQITGKTIRSIQRYQATLSAKATRWVLPFYLRFCLTPEAEYNRMETESLIYAFGPDSQFKEDTLQRLSLLNQDQINCLIHFFEWCLNDEYWMEYCPENINKAIIFLQNNGHWGLSEQTAID